MIAKHRSLSVEARQMMRAQRLQLIRDRYRKVVLEPRAEAEKGPSRPGPIASDDAAGSVDHVPAYSQNRPALKNPYAERYQKRLKDVRVEASSGPLDESLADALFGSPDTF